MDHITLEEFELELHELTPLEAKCKALRGRRRASGQGLATLIAQAKRELVAEGYSIYARPYEPVDIRDGFITYTDNSEITAIYQSRYLPVYEHTHDFIEAIFVYEGRCDLFTDEGTIKLAKGDLCIVSPSCRHDHNVMDDTSVILLIAIKCDTFNSSLFGLLEHRDVFSDFFLTTLYDTRVKNSLLFRTGDDRQIADTILEMHYERSINAELCSQMLSSLLSRLLVLLLRNHQDHVEILDPIGSGSNARLIPILRDIQGNLKETTLNSLADKFGHSISSLSRLIKNHTGKTYKTLVRELRAKLTAKLLRNPRLSIIDIVDMAGYCDVSHLYKDFRWFYQITPGQFRKGLGGDPAGKS
jgi:AraC-like DNA-binding protein